MEEARSIWKDAPLGDSSHRGKHFNNNILPLALPIVETIGFRLAYDAALAHDISPDLVAVFEAGVVLRGSSWFVEHLGMKRREILAQEERALSELLPRLDGLIEGSVAKRYSTAPMLSDESWEQFVDLLPTFEPPLEEPLMSGLEPLTMKILARL